MPTLAGGVIAIGGGDVVGAGRTIGLCVVVRERRGKALAASAFDSIGGVDGVCGRDADAGMPRIVPLAGASRSITDSVMECDGSIGSGTGRAPEIDAATSCSSITGGGGSAAAAAMLSSPTGRAHGERDDGRGRGWPSGIGTYDVRGSGIVALAEASMSVD